MKVGAITSIIAAMANVRVGAAERPAFLKSGDRVVFCGDSITEQRMYANYVEDYLSLRYPEMNLSFVNAGWGGDTAKGGALRLDRDVLAVKPDVVILCYGMNDGGYCYVKPEDAAGAFGKSMRAIVKRLKARKVRVVMLTNGAADDSVDALKWLRDVGDYNAGALKAIKNEALRIAADEGLPSFDLFTLMLDTLARAKKEGVDMGKDGIHPDESGSLIMAYGLLKALGVPPRHEEIRADLSAGKGRGNPAVRNLERTGDGWTFDLKLDGLPYCVDEKARKMLPYLPFTQEFNDVRFAIDGLPDGSWYLKLDGAITPVMTRGELDQGLSLTSLWGTAPMAAATRFAAATREKCNLYRQFWRALALPDNFVVEAPYDRRPHMLGLKLAGEAETWRRSLLVSPVVKVEVVRVDRAPIALKAGQAITKWRMAAGFSAHPAKLTAPSAPPLAGWAEAVLEDPNVATGMKCAYANPNPVLVNALAVLESDAAQEAVVTLEGQNDFLVCLNGRDGPSVKEEDAGKDIKLALTQGRNVLLLVARNKRGPVDGFRVIIKSAAAGLKQAF